MILNRNSLWEAGSKVRLHPDYFVDRVKKTTANLSPTEISLSAIRLKIPREPLICNLWQQMQINLSDNLELLLFFCFVWVTNSHIFSSGLLAIGWGLSYVSGTWANIFHGYAIQQTNISKIWKILENFVNVWKILENLENLEKFGTFGKFWKNLKNLEKFGKFWKILNILENWKILENLNFVKFCKIY